MSEEKKVRYTEDHDWAKKENHEVKVGITDFAQNELGDIVFVELPESGDSFDKGEDMVVIESVKSVSDVKAPVGGQVIEVNQSLEGTPEKINESPFEEGWLVKLDMEDDEEFSELLDESAYENLIAEQS